MDLHRRNASKLPYQYHMYGVFLAVQALSLAYQRSPPNADAARHHRQPNPFHLHLSFRMAMLIALQQRCGECRDDSKRGIKVKLQSITGQTSLEYLGLCTTFPASLRRVYKIMGLYDPIRNKMRQRNCLALCLKLTDDASYPKFIPRRLDVDPPLYPAPRTPHPASQYEQAF